MKLRLCALFVLVVAVAGCSAKTVGAAMGFGTGGVVDTDFPISEIDGKPFSITLKFMLRWPNSYYNAFVGESGTTGTLFIGKDNARPFATEPVRLAVNIGGTSGVYSYTLLSKLTPIRPMDGSISWVLGRDRPRAEMRSAVPISQGRAPAARPAARSAGR